MTLPVETNGGSAKKAKETTAKKAKDDSAPRLPFPGLNRLRRGDKEALTRVYKQMAGAVMAAKGEIDVYSASRIQTALLNYLQMRRIALKLAETEEPPKPKPGKHLRAEKCIACFKLTVHVADAYPAVRCESCGCAWTVKPKYYRPVGVVLTKEMILADGTKATETVGMTIETWLALNDKFLRCKESFDKCLVSMGLGAKEKASVWDTLYPKRGPLMVGDATDEDDDDEPDDAQDASGQMVEGAPTNGQADAAGADGQDPDEPKTDEGGER